MIETEAKIKLSKKEVKRVLGILGKPSFFSQENMIYKIKKGACLRIRFEKNKTIVTYKGKIRKSKFKSRRELEFSLPGSHKDRILRLLGIINSKYFFYRKYRANFTLNHCTISIDKLPNKQIYIEIEGNIKNINKNLKTLKLQSKSLEKRSYMDILKKNAIKKEIRS